MKLTKHAIKRTQQRGTKEDEILLISIFGERIAEDKEGIKLQIPEKIRRHLFSILDKCRSKVIVTDKIVSKVLTVYTLTH